MAGGRRGVKLDDCAETDAAAPATSKEENRMVKRCCSKEPPQSYLFINDLHDTRQTRTSYSLVTGCRSLLDVAVARADSTLSPNLVVQQTSQILP